MKKLPVAVFRKGYGFWQIFPNANVASCDTDPYIYWLNNSQYGTIVHFRHALEIAMKYERLPVLVCPTNEINKDVFAIHNDHDMIQALLMFGAVQ